MRAMLLERPAPVETSPLAMCDLPIPEPGPRELRVRVEACGVCRTDLHIVEGELRAPRLPLVPGHQIVGMVDAVGAEVERFRVGERAGMAWLHSACGSCEFCESDRENLCESARFTGFDALGGFADYALGDARFAYRLPPGYAPHEAAPLLCAGIIGYRSLRLSALRPGERLGLYGFGAAAHIALQVALAWGCEVFVFSRDAAHRRLALELGASWVGRAEEEPPARLHSSIILAPAGPLVPRALEQLERGGTLALGGITMSPIPELDYTRHLYQERRIVSVTNSTRRDGEELLALADKIGIRTHTEVFPLSEANRALQLLKASKIEASAVLDVAESRCETA